MRIRRVASKRRHEALKWPAPVAFGATAIEFLDTSVYRGPNVYALFPVIRHTVDLGQLEDWPTGRLGREFVDALVDCLPGLKEHGCSYREPGGFIRRMLEDEGTWLGHVLEHVVLELQGVAGSDVSFGKTLSLIHI